MKKIIFVVAAAICFQFAAFSQARIGLAGGTAIGNMYGSNAEGGNARAGLMASFLVEKSLNKSLALRPSLSYVQKGKTYPHPQGTLIDKSYIALRYVEFNPDILYYVSGNAGAGFYLGASPSIAFNLPSKKVTVTDDVKTTTVVHFGKEPINDLRGTDWGANFVAGWRTKGGFLINFNYNHGFRNLVTEGSTGELRNSYFGLQLGVYLNNGNKDK